VVSKDASEHDIMQRIRKAAPLYQCVLLRNNVGHTTSSDGRHIIFGLCVGSSDLIGWTTKNNVAIFTAIEVKTRVGRVTKEQQRFIDAVKKAGGLAGVARSVEDFIKIICN
jgi:hypothetical protein